MISQIAQCVWFLTKAFYCAFPPRPISNGCFLWCCRYGGFEGIPASHILLSQKPDPKEKQVINLDQDVQVCGYFFFVDGVWTPLYAPSLSFLSFLFGSGAISFFLTCLSMWHTFFGYASFIFFLHSPISLIYFKREWCHTWTWSFILWMDICLLLV